MNKIEITKKQNLIQVIKFTLFSMSAGIIEVITFSIMSSFFKMKYWPSYLIALILSVLFNFTVNRKFTFKSAKNIPLAMSQVGFFYLIFVPLSTWWGDVLCNYGIYKYVVLIGTMLVNFISEFLFCRLVVYRKSMYTNKEGKEEIKNR